MQEWVHPKHQAGGAPGRVWRGISVQLLSPPCTQKSFEATWSIYRAGWKHCTCQPQELPAGPGKAIARVEQLPGLRTPGMASLVCVTIVSLRVVRASVSPQGIAQLCKWVRAPVFWD